MTRISALILLVAIALAACGIDGEPLTPPAKSAS